MKLRIKGNSLRLRLTRGEVGELKESGQVFETVTFGSGNNFIYKIESVDERDEISADFRAKELVISVPTSLVQRWAASDQVSLEANELKPTILIEKDFACLEPRPGEDETDMFSNPGNTLCKSA
jgi:hypothetical protein